MTKTLYDPEVEKRGIEKGRVEGIKKGIEKGRAEGKELGRVEGIKLGRAEGIEQGKMAAAIKYAKSLLDILDDKTISEKLEIEEEVVRKLREEAASN